MHRPVIVSFARTPITKLSGALSKLGAGQLGSVTVKESVKRACLAGSDIQEVIMGNVVSANVGQAPARQASRYAGLPDSTVCTTVNKVCASGMKTVQLASQAIMLGHRDTIVAGGMESMSNIPYYLPKARTGYRLGHGQLVDGLVGDGLWDVYNNQHMGMCAEKCATDYSISREEQDAYAIESFKRVMNAHEKGLFKDEIIGVEIKGRKGIEVVDEDDNFVGVKIEKMPSLKPVFKREDGTVTAANASTINDGAASMVVMSEEKAKSMGLKPLARILGFADAEQNPVDFTTAPSLAVPLALKQAGMSMSDMEYHEINEAFAVVALANMKLLNLDHAKVNVNGGAVGLGHPIGMSGARIIGSLYSVLKQNDATFGTASICNGGGGASAIVIERLN